MKRLAIAALIALELVWILGYSAGYASASRSPLVMPSASPRQSDRAEIGAPNTVGPVVSGGAPTPAARPSEVRDLDVTEPTAAEVSARGTASWYDDPRKDGLYAAAGPALRTGDWRGSTVEVCAARCVRVVLSDYCRCVVGSSERIIDLSSSAFSALAPLSRGLIRVTVTP